MDAASLDHTPASLRVRRGHNTISSLIRASLAAGCGLTRQEIEAIEAGAEDVGPAKVSAYAKTLRIRSSYLQEAMRVARGERVAS